MPKPHETTITAIDLSVLMGLSGPAQNGLTEHLEHLKGLGPVLVCGAVLTALVASGIKPAAFYPLLNRHQIEVDASMNPDIWAMAGVALLSLSQHDQQTQHPPDAVLLAGLVGAHASHRASQLFTLVPEHYRAFPRLRLWTPEHLQ